MGSEKRLGQGKDGCNMNIKFEYGSLRKCPWAQSKVLRDEDPEFRQDHLGEAAPRRGTRLLLVNDMQVGGRAVENTSNRGTFGLEVKVLGPLNGLWEVAGEPAGAPLSCVQ